MGISILDFGARANGGGLQHREIQAAIDRCHAAGGGRVSVPPGAYQCGAMELRSGVELHLEHNAVILGSREAVDYEHCTEGAILWADGSEHISITGRGRIDAQAHGPVPKPAPPFRSKSVVLNNCRDVLVRDITLQYSDFWCLHLRKCDRVRIIGIVILNDLARINSDGIDPDSCRDVIISDCHITAGDDCIVLKALQDAPTENVVITNCVLETACAAVKLGTESVGDIRRVAVSNCVVKDCLAGLALYMKDGGTYEDVQFSNIAITANVHRHGLTSWPIIVDLDKRSEESGLGRIRRVGFSDIGIASSGHCLIQGMKGRPVEDLSLDNVRFAATGPLRLSTDGKPGGGGLELRHSRQEDYSSVAAYFVAANIAGLNCRSVRVDTTATGGGDDSRCMACLNVTGGVLDGVCRFPRSEQGPSGVHTESCSRLAVRD